MKEQTVLKLKLPLRKKDGTVYSAKQLLEKLAKEPSGHYLLGDYNYWHGGVHFSDQDYKDDLVQAIADGTIVAYRINKNYEEMDLTTRPPAALLNAVAGTALGVAVGEIGAPVSASDITSAVDVVATTSNMAAGVTNSSTNTSFISTVLNTSEDAGITAASSTEKSAIENMLKDIVNEHIPRKPTDSTLPFGSCSPEEDGDYIFKYSTSFCLIKHQYKSPDAAIKMLPSNNTKNIVRVTSGNGLTRWGKKGSDNSHGKFTKDTLFEIKNEETSTTKDGDTLHWAEGYELDKDSLEPLKPNGVVTQYWMNIGKNSARNVEKYTPPANTDWNDLETITVQAQGETGYADYPALPLQNNTNLRQVSIPAETVLTLQKNAPTSTIEGLVYYQVTANKPLPITLIPNSSKDAPLAEVINHPQGSIIWYPITNSVGVTRTGKDASNKDTPVAKPNPKANELTFYSLYMHLLPYEAYEDAELIDINASKKFVITIKSFVDERSKAEDGAAVVDKKAVGMNIIYEVVGQKKNGDFNFLNVYRVDGNGNRSEPQKACWIKEGGNNSQKQYIAYVKSHTFEPPKPPEPKKHPMHWVYGHDVECEVINRVDVLKKTANNGVEQIGELTAKNTFTYAMPKGLNNPKAKFIECKLTSGQVVNDKKLIVAKAGDTFYLSEESFENVKQDIKPQTFDTVVPCSIPVKAGDHLGYLGLYEKPVYPATETEKMDNTPSAPANASPEAKAAASAAATARSEAAKSAATPPKGMKKISRHQLHFEIFTNDELQINSFLDNQAQVTVEKKYLKVNKGAKLVIGTNFDAPSKAITNLHTHYFTDAKTPTLKRDWYWELSKTSISTTNKGVEWYKLPIKSLGDKEFGWIKKADQNEVLNQYDLRKLGFTIIEEMNPQAHGDVFVNAGQMGVAGNANTLEHFFEDILKEIDSQKTGQEEKKGVISLAEIRKAYSDQEGLAQTLQKIIAKYPTEWMNELKIEDVVANRLKLYINANGTTAQKAKLEEVKDDPKKILETFQSAHRLVFYEWEQERIKKLLFWNEAGLAAAPQVYHFHPIYFINSLGGSALPEMDVAPIDPKLRWIFVLHSTGGLLSKEYIKAINVNWRGHKYIMKDGEVIEVWPFTKKDVRATKTESLNSRELQGQMFHVELNYADNDKPTENQYQVLAELYIEASIAEGYWPRIIPHIEIDRGIKDGHRDPVDFDYNHFYQILKDKDVPIDKIPHFGHDRYWNYPYSKIPWGTDTRSWPPTLSGNPHK